MSTKVTVGAASDADPVGYYNDPLMIAAHEFNPELLEIRKRLDSKAKLTKEECDQIAKLVTKIGTEINLETESRNCMTVGRALQEGDVLNCMRTLMTHKVNGRRSRAEFKKFMNSMLDDYVASVLSKEGQEGGPRKLRAANLKVSRRRQLTRYMNLAQCGEGILKYNYAGITAALEVRYLLCDILKMKGGKKQKLEQDMARAELAIVEARFPFPRLDEIKGRGDVREEFRHHVDTVAIMYQLEKAGFTQAETNVDDAHSFACDVGLALEAKDAVALFVSLADVKGVPQRRLRLKNGLFAIAKTIKGNRGNPKPAQIIEFLAKIVKWHELHPTKDVLSEIKTLPEISEKLTAVQNITDELFKEIGSTKEDHDDNTATA